MKWRYVSLVVFAVIVVTAAVASLSLHKTVETDLYSGATRSTVRCIGIPMKVTRQSGPGPALEPMSDAPSRRSDSGDKWVVIQSRPLWSGERQNHELGNVPSLHIEVVRYGKNYGLTAAQTVALQRRLGSLIAARRQRGYIEYVGDTISITFGDAAPIHLWPE